MTRTVLALLALALLLTTLGQAESPACKLSDQARVVSVVTFPCANGDHLVEISSAGAHPCNCNLLMLPASALPATMSPFRLLYSTPLHTQRAVALTPSTPPPRLA